MHASSRHFLDFRAGLARRMQEEWLKNWNNPGAPSRTWIWC